MMKTGTISKAWIIIAGFALTKLLLHLLVSSNYELQRDAYLYLALGDHLSWGYISVPPSIAVFGKISQLLFGDSGTAIRVFPALLGSASVIFVGLIVKELKGNKIALFIACLAFLLSPAYLRTNSLFQPVAFNQFYWILSSYLIIRLINTKNTRYWILLFIIWGLAFLNKYSISFFMLGFFVSLLLVKQRFLYNSKHFLIGGLLGIIIISPNLIWQYNHNWPVIHHMAELHQNQLVHVTLSGFILDQFIMNAQAILIWPVGLFVFLFSKRLKKYRILSFLFLSTIIIIVLASGKSYYTLGLYPLMLAMGAKSIEKYFQGNFVFLRYVVILSVFIVLPFIPYGLPVLKPPKMQEYASKTSHLLGHAPLRWEDGRIHSIPQDYADMTGWKELSSLVINAYNELPDYEKNHCMIFAENYGEAGSIKYYGKNQGIPEPVSFSDNFLLWAPDKIDKSTKVFLYINFEMEDLKEYFGKYTKAGQVSNPYFRESGVGVFVLKEPKESFYQLYKETAKELKSRYKR